MTVLAELCAGVEDGEGLVRALGQVVGRVDLGSLGEREAVRQLDAMMSELDVRMSAQVDVILHDPVVQALESSWLEIAFLVDRVDYDNHIITEILSCTREELDEDLTQSPEVTSSGVYRIVYRSAIGTYGGVPYGLVCACFAFGPGVEDVSVLRLCASIAAMAHAPFIADVDPSFFDVATFGDLPRLQELESALDGPRFALWRSFRATEDARYIGLCLPRFLLRRPHDVHRETTTPLRYREALDRGSRDLLWGHASVVFAVIAAGSFARYRWCVFLTGSHAGSVAPLLRWDYASFPGIWARCPLECVITSRVERSLAECGFIGLVFERGLHQASILSAPSVKQTTALGERLRRDEDVGERLGSQLTYVFLICRLAHYLKCVQLQQIGTETDRGALEHLLTQWIRRYISDMEDPSPEILADRPLRSASIQVEAVEGQAGWYRCHLRVRPHLTHNNATFTLALVGKLDRPLAGDLGE